MSRGHQLIERAYPLFEQLVAEYDKKAAIGQQPSVESFAQIFAAQVKQVQQQINGEMLAQLQAFWDGPCQMSANNNALYGSAQAGLKRVIMELGKAKHRRTDEWLRSFMVAYEHAIKN
ncbi:hypothetical protein M3Y99_01335900 [Aphelenchoides fujianensis]|nr:hypothetical protein M3Y99_01335900 [Aphelenchoides fujianensis]